MTQLWFATSTEEYLPNEMLEPGNQGAQWSGSIRTYGERVLPALRSVRA